MNRSTEIAEKVVRIGRWADARGIDGVLVSRRDMFAWVTAGAGNAVLKASDTGMATAFVDRRRLVVLATNIEAPRLAAEEFANLPEVEIRAYPWHQGPLVEQARAAGHLPPRLVSDTPIEGAGLADPSFAKLAWTLLPVEIERARALAKDAVRTLENAAWQAQPKMTEAEIAGLIEREARAHDVEAVVVLVAADERIARFRHPTPTQKIMNERAMLVLCARRHGIIISLTRLLSWSPIDADLSARHRAVLTVDHALNTGTVVGRTAKDVFADAVAAYAECGFADEWKKHHQGGAGGYQPRTWVASPESAEVVEENQLFAWNPSITGTKSEDTILVTKNGIEFLTSPGEAWPTIEVERRGRVLRRGGILVR